jgi:hypothetical protein
MALLWLEGFEGYGETLEAAPAPAGVMARKYGAVTVENLMRLRTGRYGNASLYYANSSCYLETPALTTHDTMISGCGWKVNTTSDCAILSFKDGATYGMWVRKKSGTTELEIVRGATVLDATAGLNLHQSAWYFVEMKIKCHDSAGEYEVRVNGKTVLSATGVDTKEGSNNYHDIMSFRPQNVSRLCQYDDWYVCDGSGATHNDFLGDCKIIRIDPDGDDTANWGTSTPSANHYENVDETETDDDTSYLEESVSTTLDLFDYEDVSSLGTIQGVQLSTECRDTDANAFSIITPIESGGNQYDDSAQSIGTESYVTKRRVAGVDPDTSSLWTATNLNAAKFGVKVN